MATDYKKRLREGASEAVILLYRLTWECENIGAPSPGALDSARAFLEHVGIVQAKGHSIVRQAYGGSSND